MTHLRMSRRFEGLGRAGSRLTEDQMRLFAERGGSVLGVTAHPVVPLPNHILEAVAVASRDPAYAPSAGTAELRIAIAEHLEVEFERPVDPSEILVTNGAMHALHIVFLALLDAGDEVVTPAPCFFFDGIVELGGARLAFHETEASNDHGWNLQNLPTRASPQRRILLINSPTNPTRYVCTAEDLEAALEYSANNDLYLVSDESYDTFVYDGKTHLSPARVSSLSHRSHTVVIRSFTKSFAMPGWRVGYVYADRELIQRFSRVLEWINLYTNHVAQAAAAAAMNGPKEWINQLSADLQDNRDLLWSLLSQQGHWKTSKPSGTPFFLMTLSGNLARTSEELAAHLAIGFGIPATAGSVFHAGNAIRVPFGGPRAEVRRLGERLVEAAHSVSSREVIARD